MEITEEMLNHMILLSNLQLSSEEKKQAKKDMEQMIKYVSALEDVDNINEVNIEDDANSINDSMDNSKIVNVFREDTTICYNQTSLEGHREQILFNAPKRKENGFVVPKTID